VIKTHFPAGRFRKDHQKTAGKKLKHEGEEACVEYLRNKVSDYPPNFKPPAKGTIVAQSRPFSEWPIVRASEAIQKYVYGLTVAELDVFSPGTSKPSHAEWFAKTGVENYGYRQVQGLNTIFQNTVNRFKGVLKKVENRNKKSLKRQEGANRRRVEEGLPEVPVTVESATDDEGRLLQPPGVNPSIYGYQGVAPRVCTDLQGFSGMSVDFAGYRRDPDAVLVESLPEGRLSIPKGERGYVPEWQRDPERNKFPLREGSRRQRKWYSNACHKPKPGRTSKYDPEALKKASAKDALLVSISIGEDWAIIDVRGLLRDARRRGFTPEEGLSLNSLLGLFTEYPVFDVQRGLITFTYKLGQVDVHSRKTVPTFRSRALLESLVAKEEIALVSVDLGQTNPASMKVSRVRAQEGALVAEPVHRMFLSDVLLGELSSYRKRMDAFEDAIRAQAFETMTPEQQAEITRVCDVSVEVARRRVCEKYSISPQDVPWGEMTGHSTFIVDAVLRKGGDESLVYFKNKEGETLKFRDLRISRMEGVRPRLTKDTRDALNKAVLDLKRAHPTFAKLAKQKLELARRCVNFIEREAKRYTQCERVVFVIEDLNVGFFHGKGKRDRGWDAFFTAKKENRWVIQALHKAFSDLGLHRGSYVIEVTPQRTSMTCPRCGHCDKGNRNGEKFVCLQCGATLHADLEVATDNIERVALTGKAMPKPPVRERSGDVQKAGTARKARKPLKPKQKTEPSVQEGSSDDGVDKSPGDASRNPVYNPSDTLSI
jgi:hypothetical protein